MSNSCGSPEDVGKQRGRDGKIRREDVDDSQPEGKRLKLGNEGGNSGKDREAAAAEEAIMPCSGREEPVAEGGDEGKSDYKSDVMTLVSSAKNSPQGPVLTTLDASKAEWNQFQTRREGMTARVRVAAFSTVLRLSQALTFLKIEGITDTHTVVR